MDLFVRNYKIQFYRKTIEIESAKIILLFVDGLISHY